MAMTLCLVSGCDGNSGEEGTTDTSSETTSDTTDDPLCAGQPDYTPCEVVTEPDRSYDICVSEVCVSPGCGDASCNTPGPHFPLPDTGSRRCYDNEKMIHCPEVGNDFYGQDAQYGRDVTSTGSQRYKRTIPNGEAIVEDRITGLVWQGCLAGYSGDNCETQSNTESEYRYDWDEALSYCDSLSWGGYTDWRLPDPYELQSIMKYGSSDLPKLDNTAFPNTRGMSIWSSSTYLYNEYSAWRVDFGSGWVIENGKAGGMSVRCVRSGPFKAQSFEVLDDTGDRVVRDSLTGLEWQGCVAGLSGDLCEIGNVVEKDWKEALSYCEGLSWAGHTDWRLPNIVELTSIVDFRVNGPSRNEAAFPGGNESRRLTMSSTSDVGTNSHEALKVAFVHGNSANYKKTNASLVLCVRSES
jgi:hypothetical protein